VAIGPAPTIVSVTPSIGSTGGGSWIRIDGTGFVRGFQVALGTATIGRFDSRFTDRIFLDTPAHAPGAVDVVVTNPDRQTVRAAGAYTFASPGSFEVDGEWGGYTQSPPYDEWLTFMVVGRSVVSISCADSGVVGLSAPAPIRDGEFSHAEATGVIITGRIVARGQAVGRMNIDRCANTEWRAEPRSSAH
jgi:hypothetical protein